MQKQYGFASVVIGLATALCLPQVSLAQTQIQAQQQNPPQVQRAPKSGAQKLTSRRTQRVVPLKEVQVVSPDGKVKFTLLPNPERLSFAVTMGGSAVVDPSPLDMRVTAMTSHRGSHSAIWKLTVSTKPIPGTALTARPPIAATAPRCRSFTT